MFRHNIRKHYKIVTATEPGAPFPEALIFDKSLAGAWRAASAIMAPMPKRFGIPREIVIVTNIEVEVRNHNFVADVVYPSAERLNGAGHGHMQGEGTESAIKWVDRVAQSNSHCVQMGCFMAGYRVVGSSDLATTITQKDSRAAGPVSTPFPQRAY